LKKTSILRSMGPSSFLRVAMRNKLGTQNRWVPRPHPKLAAVNRDVRRCEPPHLATWAVLRREV
jgi:hypothetical protein